MCTPGPTDDATPDTVLTAAAMCNACHTRRQPRPRDRGPSPHAPPLRDHIVTMRVREPVALGVEHQQPLTLELRLPDVATAARVADAAVAFKAYELKAMLCAAMARRHSSAYREPSRASSSGSQPRQKAKVNKPATSLLLDELGTAFWWGKSSPYDESSLVQTREKPGGGPRPAALRGSGEAPRLRPTQPLKCPSDEPVQDPEDIEDWAAPVAEEQQLRVPDDEASASTATLLPRQHADARLKDCATEGNEAVCAEDQPIVGNRQGVPPDSTGVKVGVGIFGGFRLPPQDLCDIANSAVNEAAWDEALTSPKLTGSGDAGSHRCPNGTARQAGDDPPGPWKLPSQGFDLDEPVGWSTLPTAMPPPVAGGNGPRPWWPLIGGLSELQQPGGQEALTAPPSANNTPRLAAGAAESAVALAELRDQSPLETATLASNWRASPAEHDGA